LTGLLLAAPKSLSTQFILFIPGLVFGSPSVVAGEGRREIWHAAGVSKLAVVVLERERGGSPGNPQK